MRISNFIFSNKLFLFVVYIFFLNGCAAVSYYSQTIAGHSKLMNARKPIDDVIVDADDTLKNKLLVAVEIRKFASATLGLPLNKSYTSYVQLENDIPIWNVIAAKEFSLKGKQWCYLVIGCASYRGYYDKENAKKHAEELKEMQYEVYLSGATAYSTLGWFADPLTSAMIKRSDAGLADLIFHELAHQQLYVKGDSRFNEAFASAVGEQGAQLWLSQTGRVAELEKYKTSLSVRDDFLGLVNTTKVKLKELYASDKIDVQKRREKNQIFEKMKQDYDVLKKVKWNNKDWYSRWFDKPINNARFVAIATYRDLVPDFVDLFNRCERDFSRFYKKVKNISEQDERKINVECEM